VTVSPGEPVVAAYDAVVCDLDGVVYRGPVEVAYAVPSLAAVRRQCPVVFATNNASRTPGQVADQVRALGLEVAADDVRTSAQAGADLLASRFPRGSSVLAVGGPGVGEALRAVGLVPVTEGSVVAVLQGWGAEVSVTDLANASIAIAAGATWVATNLDRTLPTDRGIVPGNGTLVAAVATATGRTPEVVGKPFAPLYRSVADFLGLATGRLLAVGDRLDTDIEGAAAAGMASMWVLTGVDGFVELARSRVTPTYAAADLRGLLRPAPVVRRDGVVWHEGDIHVHVDLASGSVNIVAPQGSPSGTGDDDGSAATRLVAVCARLVTDLRDEASVTADRLASIARQLDGVGRNSTGVVARQ
jgi:glycerol 3-phosphatase-2